MREGCCWPKESVLPLRDPSRDRPDDDHPSQSADERDRRCDLGTLYVPFSHPLFDAGGASSAMRR